MSRGSLRTVVPLRVWRRWGTWNTFDWRVFVSRSQANASTVDSPCRCSSSRMPNWMLPQFCAIISATRMVGPVIGVPPREYSYTATSAIVGRAQAFRMRSSARFSSRGNFFARTIMPWTSAISRREAVSMRACEDWGASRSINASFMVIFLPCF